jgi:hypothetical protein
MPARSTNGGVFERSKKELFMFDNANFDQVTLMMSVLALIPILLTTLLA